MIESILREGRGDIAAVSEVKLDHFRNYGHLEVRLGRGFNVFAGPNGQGKTNFLEALHLVTTTRLLRGQRDVEAIQDGFSSAQVSVVFGASQTEAAIRLDRGAKKKASLNGLGLPRPADLLGRLPCVCISSEDMEIVRGEPSERRLFLDLELSSRFPAYLRHLSVYKRALEQRNAIIRASKEWFQPSSSWEPWEEQMAEHGAQLRSARQKFIDEIQEGFGAFHARIGDGEPVNADYTPRDEGRSETELRDLLERSRNADVGRGSTGVGPHRDELCFQVEGREARLFGSQGQQRTTVIALKLACMQAARQAEGVAPLLLLDDIFSDLDEKRRARLVGAVVELASQAVLTCTEASSAGPEILEQAMVYQVNAGEVHLQ
jgi:DNA replication and repair protein RecF